MCGIFGLITTGSSTLSKNSCEKIVDKLFVLSESRGKESSGIAIKNTVDKKIQLLKEPLPASKLIESKRYQDFFQGAIASCFDKNGRINSPLAIMAHARLVTNGTQENNNNNQPVIKDTLVTVHNGIITNSEDLWRINNHLNRKYEVDTEIFLGLINEKVQRGLPFIEAIQSTYQETKGTISTCIFSSEYNCIILASNNASLYYTINEQNGILLFASERFILQHAIDTLNLKDKLNLVDVKWSDSFSAIKVELDDLNCTHFKLNIKQDDWKKETSLIKDQVINHSEDTPIDFKEVKRAKELHEKSHLHSLLEYNPRQLDNLKRCSNCILPETFPFIKFNSEGKCNYCESYIVKKQGDREGEFREIVRKFKLKNGKPNCIIPFSGGRDSSYGLHYIVKELGLSPITYTYDWGMVTDLARRNIARVCGKLGIENIIVSADLPEKRKNIRLNVEAWLKKPQLGMIPLFMAGDKQFLHFVNVIKKQTGISFNIWSTNSLENTDFKTGFCGIKPFFDKTRPDFLPIQSKIKLAWYYGKNILANPAYINSSLIDTLSSFYSYYAAARVDYFQLFDWIKWDEKHIEKTLFEEYDWEISPDTTTTWRIGDGTAAFYNYIYYTVAGFSEFDTFRSNQIREGLITREQGLEYIKKENRPRFESLLWYLDSIGIDFKRAITIINDIPKMYPTLK